MPDSLDNQLKMTTIIGLDPGSERSALVWWDGSKVLDTMFEGNAVVRTELNSGPRPHVLAIEKIASYGMPVGAEVFETVFWSGLFAQAYGIDRVLRIPRMDVKMHLCHSARAKDSNIRQALIDRFGPVGTKKTPGALFGISGDLWAALAVAVTVYDKGLMP